MVPKKIEKYIVKYLANQATLNELDELSLWLKKPANKSMFVTYVKTNYAINYSMKQYNASQTKKNLLDVINKEKRTYRLQKTKRTFLKYAAVILICLTAGYAYLKGYVFSDKELVIPEEKITLQLDNNKQKIVINTDELKKTFTFNGNVLGVQTGNKISYNKAVKNETLIYNTLTVPYGKRFKVELSDGTLVDLNAGSSLKYPVNFVKGEPRKVFLNGEAFFNVTKDKDHPFIVNANEIDVKVLGTKFNVSSYPEDENINTVLVEGSVGVYKKGEAEDNKQTPTMLKPGNKAAWNKTSNTINVSQTDIESHIAWINGRLILYEVPFNDILKKLERQYNVVLVNNNKALEGRYFTAKFDVEDIYQVMKSLSLSGKFTYKFKEDKIIINP
ncbi:FecR family protein [Seonamhaeicola sp.]|uniref:FecR family protein n=1 Tax=Seonamhaeicola sp. TaxID=1912245 RepID=UPI003562B5F6